MYGRRMKNVSDIIALWGKTSDFADALGVEYMTAHQWIRRNRVPPEHWSGLVKAANRRGFHVTEALLAQITAAQKRKVLAEKAKREGQRRSVSRERQAVSA
jgi:hypothetical protein